VIKLCIGLVVALVVGAAIGADDDAARSKPDAAVVQVGQVDCGPSGVDATVALAYNPDSVGKVAGAYLDVGFAEPLELPQADDELRKRLTGLMPPEYHLTLRAPTGRAGDRKLRLSLTTAEAGIPPQNAFKLRFDCPAGSRVRPNDVTCKIDQAADAAGLPLPDTLARQVRCTVARIEPLKATTATSQR
jgi:hypothetical protein